MDSTAPSRILLVDDHRIFNDGLKRLLDEQHMLSVCGQVYDPKELFINIAECWPDLILLDINLQGQNGIDLGKKLLAKYSNLKIIVLTMYDQPELLKECRRVGMHGYLLKDTTTANLLEGIYAVLNGSEYFESLPGASIADKEDTFHDSFAKKLNLTFREIEIIRYLRKGYTNEQISNELNLSFFTVKTHRKNIHFKLGITNIASLIEYARLNGI